jgi:hypothetical protein
MKRTLAIFFALVSLLIGVTTSHAALYFPHVATQNPWQTEICVINPSATETVQGNLESYSNNGVLVASMPLSVAPNARRQIDVGTELTNAGNTGYIVLQNTSGSPVGYTKFTQSGGDRVAIPAVDSTNTGSIYITHIAWEPWWTGISLVNTTTATKNLTIRFNTGETRTKTLGPKQHQAFMVADLFGGQIRTDIVSAIIQDASGIVGLELFGQGNQLGGVPLISKTATTLYYPHVASDNVWWTGIVAYNPSSTAAQITVNPYDMQGNLLSSSTQSLGPGQKFIGDSTDPRLNLPPATAWFSLQSQNPLVGFELFGTADGNRLAGYSVVDIEGKVGIFPKVEKDGWTGIAFVNTESQQATVTLKAYNDAGNVLGTGAKILNPHAKWVGVVESLFTGVNLNTATYLSFSADRNVAGFQLNNSSSDTMLDALPALRGSSPSEFINKVLDLFKYQSTVTLGIQTVTDIMGKILSSSPGGTCPQVTVNPPLTDLSALPSTITITASYGNGCTATDGSTMSGQVILVIANLAMTETSFSLDYTLTATNLTRNGVLMLNGSVSGNIALKLNGSVITQATVSVHFDNFQVAESSISGNLTMTATNLDLSGGTVNITDMTISFDNLTAAGYTVNSGTLQVTSAGSNTIQMVANLNTDQGAVNITLIIQTPSDTRTIIRTPTPGTIADYMVTLTNVTMDKNVCGGYPSNGSITVSKGGSSTTVVFTPTTCPVGQMRVQASSTHDRNPSHDRNPWINFSTCLYKYLTIKR